MSLRPVRHPHRLSIVRTALRCSPPPRTSYERACSQSRRSRALVAREPAAIRSRRGPFGTSVMLKVRALPYQRSVAKRLALSPCARGSAPPPDGAPLFAASMDISLSTCCRAFVRRQDIWSDRNRSHSNPPSAKSRKARCCLTGRVIALGRTSDRTLTTSSSLNRSDVPKHIIGRHVPASPRVVGHAVTTSCNPRAVRPSRRFRTKSAASRTRHVQRVADVAWQKCMNRMRMALSWMRWPTDILHEARRASWTVLRALRTSSR